MEILWNWDTAAEDLEYNWERSDKDLWWNQKGYWTWEWNLLSIFDVTEMKSFSEIKVM